MDTKLIVSASPHLRSEETTTGLMANVIVALVPCVVASAIIFGLRAMGGPFGGSCPAPLKKFCP